VKEQTTRSASSKQTYCFSIAILSKTKTMNDSSTNSMNVSVIANTPRSTEKTGRVPRGRPKTSGFRDDENLRFSNHLTPRYFTRSSPSSTKLTETKNVLEWASQTLSDWMLSQPVTVHTPQSLLDTDRCNCSPVVATFGVATDRNCLQRSVWATHDWSPVSYP